MIDAGGKLIGDMSTSEGIRLAKSSGLELFLVDFHKEPPVCMISDIDSVPDAPRSLDYAEGFSFDPTLRPATIQFSSAIADEELERKVGILRKHLLEKKRCEVVVLNKDGRKLQAEVRELLEKILEEVRDIAKLADSTEIEEVHGEVRVRVWPCAPEQVSWSNIPPIEIGEVPDQVPVRLTPKGSPRQWRAIRRRLDPKIVDLDKHKRKMDDDEG